jgi:hypothetical protein
MVPDRPQTAHSDAELDNFLAYLGGRMKAGADMADVMQAALDVVVEYAEEVGAAERLI